MALAAARTSQVLTETPRRAAASSTRALSCSGRRSVMRRVPPSSRSTAGPAVSGPGVSAAGAVGGWVGDGEAEVAAAEPDVDGTGGELAGDLLRRLGQGTEQRQADGGLERGGEPLR